MGGEPAIAFKACRFERLPKNCIYSNKLVASISDLSEDNFLSKRTETTDNE